MFERQLFIGLQSPLDLLGPVGLPLGDVGGLEGQGLVLVVGDVLLMGRGFVGRFGGIELNGQVMGELFDYELEQESIDRALADLPQIRS